MTVNLTPLTEQTVFQTVEFSHPTYGPLDPTGYAVEMALAPFGEEPDAFFAATWADDTDDAGRHLVHAVFGADDTTGELTAGTLNQIWVRVTLPSETPVLKGDTVFVL
jgi:hypothetical protein